MNPLTRKIIAANDVVKNYILLPAVRNLAHNLDGPLDPTIHRLV